MMELVFDNEHGFSEDQFRILIKAVDSSSVMKLWLSNCVSVYKEWIGNCPFSRNDVEIIWYNYTDLLSKWFDDKVSLALLLYMSVLTSSMYFFSQEENSSSDGVTSLQHLQQ